MVQSAVGMQCKFVAMSVATNSIPIRFGRVRKYLPNSTVPYRKVRYGTGRGKKVPAESNISIRSYVYRVYQMVRYTIIMTSGIHIVYQGLPTDSGCNNNQPASLGLSFTTNIPPNQQLKVHQDFDVPSIVIIEPHAGRRKLLRNIHK